MKRIVIIGTLLLVFVLTGQYSFSWDILPPGGPFLPPIITHRYWGTSPLITPDPYDYTPTLIHIAMAIIIPFIVIMVLDVAPGLLGYGTGLLWLSEVGYWGLYWGTGLLWLSRSGLRELWWTRLFWFPGVRLRGLWWRRCSGPGYGVMVEEVVLGSGYGVMVRRWFSGSGYGVRVDIADSTFFG